jgi:hypothetical protein
MTWREVEQISQSGIEIGSHSATHPYLSRLREAEIHEELRASQAAIEDRIGRRVDSLAYPYGASTPLVRRAAARHFRLACGTRLASVSDGCDTFNLPRLDTYYFQKSLWFRSLGQRRGDLYVGVRRSLRSLRRRGDSE